MAETKKDGKKGPTKRTSAQKRILQSVKAEGENRAYRSKVSTATKSLKEAIAKKESATVQAKLATMYSLVDKGVKTGVFKQNKAARVKSNLSKLAKAV